MPTASRLMPAALPLALCAALAGCNNPPSDVSAGGAKAAAPVEIGAPLYAGVPMPALPPGQPTGEPVVVPNAVVSFDVIQLPARTDGPLELIASPAPTADPADADTVYHPRDPDKKERYRRVKLGDTVTVGQILGRIDEQLVVVQRESARSVMAACRMAIAAAKLAEDKQDQSLQMTKKLGVAASQGEILEKESLLARYVENRVSSEKELAKATGEFQSADAQLSRHWVRSPINGRVIRLLKSPSEFAKAGEVVMEIQATDRVRVEGKIPAGYIGQVRKGTRVIVEPARSVGPNALTNSHRQEVTAVAVTGHPGRPLVVSGGLDAAALVWDITKTKAVARLAHPAGSGVRTVAATGPQVKAQLVATGTDDGTVRVWDVANPDAVGKDPAVMADTHSGPVAAAGFSPDGRFLATAAGRDVYVWNVADKKKLYQLPADHRDAVTAVRFTPQGTLVTVARDKSIRTWKLGETGGTTATVLDHRGGNVDVLGVSADGARVLFDKDSGRLDVVSLADERSVGTVQNPGGGARFATVALFSADDKSLLTVGSDADQRGELTVWETPAPGGRAAERRRLSTPKNQAVTCAAFSPDPGKRFIAVGTADGGVYFWTQAAQDDLGASIVGEVVSVTPAGPQTFDVRVEMANPLDKNGDGLQDRSQATIIVPPEGVVLPPPAAPARQVTAPAAAPLVLPAGGPVAATGAVKPAVVTEIIVNPPAAAPAGVVPPVRVPPVPLGPAKE